MAMPRSGEGRRREASTGGPLGDWWRGLKAAWHYGRGVSAYKHGRYGEAVKRFRMSASLDSRNPETKEWITRSEREASREKSSPRVEE